MNRRILVTNDDGMFAPGIKALVEVATQFGEVVVVAPDSPQSGQGHAITLEEPLRLHKVEAFGAVDSYECSGTPVDCVKLAKHVVNKGETFDLCLSGINHGSNAAINIIYSGTMSAAMEAALEGIPSIGFSLCDFSHSADMSAAKEVAKQIITNLLEGSFGKTNLLNVNIPAGTIDTIKGIKVCRQARGRWIEDFQVGTDPHGRQYYWMKGSYHKEEQPDDTDIDALDARYVSVVPIMFDLTDHAAKDSLSHLQAEF